MARLSQVILAPGMLCDAGVWGAQVAALGAQTPCLVPDYGEARTFEAMARAVLAEAPPRFAIAGHSMGGRVALEVCRLAPERVERLCLIATEHRAAPPEGPDNAEARGRAQLLQTARTQGMGAVAAAWMPHLVHPDRLEDADLTGAITGMIERQSPEIMEAQIAAGASRPDSAAVLASLTCPVLIVGGADDVIRPPASQKAMAALAPHSRILILERCGHMTPMEQPGAVTAEMTRWLQVPVPD